MIKVMMCEFFYFSIQPYYNDKSLYRFYCFLAMDNTSKKGYL